MPIPVSKTLNKSVKFHSTTYFKELEISMLYALKYEHNLIYTKMKLGLIWRHENVIKIIALLFTLILCQVLFTLFLSIYFLIILFPSFLWYMTISSVFHIHLMWSLRISLQCSLGAIHHFWGACTFGSSGLGSSMLFNFGVHGHCV